MPSRTAPSGPAGTVRTRRERAAALAADDTLLWSPVVISRWATVAVVGLLVMTGSWYAVAGEADYDDQRLGLGLALGSLVVVSFASLSLLLAGRRVIGLRRVELLGDLPVPRQPVEAAPVVAATGPSSQVLVAGTGLLRFHRADCPMAVGRDFPAVPLAEHVSQGRMACGVCQP